MSIDVQILGAGLSGLTAAGVLARAGHSVSVIDKGRGVGGRLATRRIGDAKLDHGAQFFTVRGGEFQSVIDAAQTAGVVDVWCHGFEDEDGYPRFYCPDGMTALAKWLTADLANMGVSVETNQRVGQIEAAEQGWRLPIETGGERLSGSLVVTSPVPQTLDLLDKGGVTLDPTIFESLTAITYKPTFALMVTLESASAVPSPGGIQRTEDDLFTFIADNQHKGISATPALTFHVNGKVSTLRWDDNPAIVIAELLAEAQPWIGTATVVDVQLQKWKYAGPYEPYPERHLVAAVDPGMLVLAGDAFGGPKVEGAFNSGLSAAQEVLRGAGG